MNLNWLFPVLILTSGVFLIIGVFLMLQMIRIDRKIFKGEGISLHEYLIGSGLAGACVFLISMSGILAAGSVSVYYGGGWTVYKIMEIAVLVSVVVILAVIGSLWRYFIAGKFRDLLYQKLKDKYKN